MSTSLITFNFSIILGFDDVMILMELIAGFRLIKIDCILLSVSILGELYLLMWRGFGLACFLVISGCCSDAVRRENS